MTVGEYLHAKMGSKEFGKLLDKLAKVTVERKKD